MAWVQTSAKPLVNEHGPLGRTQIAPSAKLPTGDELRTLRSVDQPAAEHFSPKRGICGEAKMDPTDEPFGPAPGQENEPDYAMSPPAEGSGLERLLLVLAVLSAALVFLLAHCNNLGRSTGRREP
jgi:hypothetical protein